VFKKRKVGYLLASFVHAVWLMLLTFWLLNWHFVHWDEGEILQFGPILKKYVLGIEKKPDQDEFIFVNVSYDNQLTDIYDDWGFPLGNTTITDRVKLAEFLSILAQTNTHKAVLCDIRLDLTSPHDSLLLAAFDKLDNYLVSNHISDSLPDKTVIPVKTAISDYSISGGAFFKFRYIINDSLKTMPLQLVELIEGKNFINKGGFLFSNGELYFNTFIVDFLVRPYDLFQSQDNFFYDNLGNLLFLEADELTEIARDKIIVIGDYERSDLHDTLLGEMPGPLILLNAYLNLKGGANKLLLSYSLVMFLGFFLISFYMIVPEDILEKKIKSRVKHKLLAGFITNILGYFIMLLIILSISYFFFGILLNLLWIGIYLMIMDKVVGWAIVRIKLS